MILNTKLNFQEHIKNIPTKVNKTIGLLPKLPKICPQEHYLRYLNRLSGLILITVMLYMTRVIIIFFIRKWSRYNITQHRLTGAISGSSMEKLYQESGLECLQQRQ